MKSKIRFFFLGVAAFILQIFLSQEVSISQEYFSPYVSPLEFSARTGIASWYSEDDPFINLRTANGEIFDDSQDTCASWDYDFGTRLKVTNLSDHSFVVCRVNDRGPARRLGRLVDLTRSSFSKIAPLEDGLLSVSVTPLAPEQSPQAK